jgi:subtilisin family serine protease
MNVQRRDVWLVAALAPALLLGACAPPVKDRADRPRWSYVRTQLPPFWWYQPGLVDVKGARAKAATGAGVVVAIVDTGVLAAHEDLAPALAGLATCGANSADTGDRSGHGTQLAGIVLGKDPGNATQGVAPAAALVTIKVD